MTVFQTVCEDATSSYRTNLNMKTLTVLQWPNSTELFIKMLKENSLFNHASFEIVPVREAALEVEKIMDSLGMKYIFQLGRFNQSFVYHCYW